MLFGRCQQLSDSGKKFGIRTDTDQSGQLVFKDRHPCKQREKQYRAQQEKIKKNPEKRPVRKRLIDIQFFSSPLLRLRRKLTARSLKAKGIKEKNAFLYEIQ